MPKYTNIFLNTVNAVRSSDNRTFTFNNLPLIQIKKKSYLYVDTSSTFNVSGSSIRVKITNLKYNKDTHYSLEPANYNTTDGIYLGIFTTIAGQPEMFYTDILTELPPQDINTIVLELISLVNITGIAPTANISISLVIEEIGDDIKI